LFNFIVGKNMKNYLVLATALLLGACECSDVCQNVDASQSAAPGTPGDFKQNIRDRVFFTFDSSKVSADAEKILEAQAGWMKVHQATTATVEGKCDARGTTEYNLALGKRRADATSKELVKLGVAQSRLKTISYGKDKLEVVGDTEEAHAQNRVAITVIN
jgi:peptidoglycan-associated lipoprotein